MDKQQQLQRIQQKINVTIALIDAAYVKKDWDLVNKIRQKRKQITQELAALLPDKVNTKHET